MIKLIVSHLVNKVNTFVNNTNTLSYNTGKEGGGNRISTEKKPLNVQIGARIKQAREQAHVTQERLAEQIEVSVQYISDLERGKVGASVSTVIKICQTLQVSCDYLLLGVEPLEVKHG